MDGGELVSAGVCVCIVWCMVSFFVSVYRIVSYPWQASRSVKKPKKKGPRRVGTADSSGQAG